MDWRFVKRRPKRHYRDDEEPDFEDRPFHTATQFGFVGHAGDCSYCGHEGHSKDECPERPVFERNVD